MLKRSKRKQKRFLKRQKKNQNKICKCAKNSINKCTKFFECAFTLNRKT